MHRTNWNPFRELDAIFDRYNRSIARRPEGGSGALVPAEWSPSVDITESDKEYLISAELPGVEKKDMNVHVENGVLRLSGERRVEEETKEAKLHRIERFYGEFSREFALPEDADTAAIRAESRDGVLKVHIPRKAPEKPQKQAVEIR